MGWPKRSHGGVRQWALALANGLVDLGHRVDMLSEAPQTRFRDDPLLDRRVGRVLLGIGPPARHRLRDYALGNREVRLVSALNHYNIHAARLKAQLGDRVNVTLTQHEHLSAEAEWLHPLLYRRLSHAVRRHFNQADAVVAVGHGVAEDLRTNWGINATRLYTIYNPAYRPDFMEQAAEPLTHPWFTPRSTPVVLAAGRLHYVKGFDRLIAAFGPVHRETGARLVILGEGKQRRALEAQVRRLGLTDVVALPGRVRSIAPWLAASDVFVVSSRTEAMSIALVEAMALGCKIVATRCPTGPEELLDHGRYGTLVDVGDTHALSAALIATMRGPAPEVAALRQRATEFSVERAITEYLKVWSALPPSR